MIIPIELQIIMKRQVFESLVLDNSIKQWDNKLLELRREVDGAIAVMLRDWDGRIKN
jgi:hypothetical protein